MNGDPPIFMSVPVAEALLTETVERTRKAAERNETDALMCVQIVFDDLDTMKRSIIQSNALTYARKAKSQRKLIAAIETYMEHVYASA